jgi:hypothetical protein
MNFSTNRTTPRMIRTSASPMGKSASPGTHMCGHWIRKNKGTWSASTTATTPQNQSRALKSQRIRIATKHIPRQTATFSPNLPEEEQHRKKNSQNNESGIIRRFWLFRFSRIRILFVEQSHQFFPAMQSL